jgi:TM2 domain-containing membrane protein YozV
MRRALIAASLSALVWPGAGQMVNRDVKKGLLLIVLSAVAAAGFLSVIGFAVFEAVSRGPAAGADDETLALLADVAARAGLRLLACGALILVVWVFAIVDAFRSARR